VNSNSKILCELSKLPFDELPRAALSILKSTLGSTIELSSGEAVFLCQAISGLSAGWTSPNPCVGAVVCDSGGKLLGYGWHEQYGIAANFLAQRFMFPSNRATIRAISHHVAG